MAEASVTIKGLNEIIEKFKSASTKLRRQVARRAVVAAAKVVGLRTRQNAPRKTGTLRRALFWHYSPKRSRPDQVVVALVRARSGKKEANRVNKKGKALSSRDAFYARFVEFGHRNVPRKGKSSKSITARRRAGLRSESRTPPHPFMGPAYQATRQQALQEFERVMTQGLTEVTR